MPSGKGKKKGKKTKIRIGGIAEREKLKAKQQAEESAKREADAIARKNGIVLVREQHVCILPPCLSVCSFV
jgi:hypothetical protein